MRTLDALSRQTVSGFSVVVVVDGTDQSPPDLPAGVSMVQVEQGGPGRARNIGVRNTDDAPLVLFLGDDMIPASDCIERHLARHAVAGGPKVAVLGHVDWHPEVPRTPLLQWIDASGMQFET